MRALIVLALVAAAAPSAQVRLEPLPVTYLPGGAGSEGCRRQWQTTAPVTAYSAPTEVSRALRTIDGMRRVDANDYSESVSAVLQAGRARAARAVQVPAVRLDRGTSERVSLGAGDTVTVLGPAGEGHVYFLAEGVTYAGLLPDGVTSVEAPVVEVWVRLVSHDATRPEAWLNTAQAGLIEREAFCE